MDLVVLAFGTGSQLSDLTEWLRNIDSWLKPDGIIFITFINEDSIVLKSKNTLDGYCRTNPSDISSLGKFIMGNNDEYLVKCIPQNVDTIKKTIGDYMNYVDYFTYPMLSGLINYLDDTRALEEIRKIDKAYAMNLVPLNHKKIQKGYLIKKKVKKVTA